MQSTFQLFNQSACKCVNFKLKKVSEGCLAYLKFSCLGKIFLKFGNQVKSTIACIGVHLKLKIYEECIKNTY